jgi:hypothetical protein
MIFGNAAKNHAIVQKAAALVQPDGLPLRINLTDPDESISSLFTESSLIQ